MDRVHAIQPWHAEQNGDSADPDSGFDQCIDPQRMPALRHRFGIGQTAQEHAAHVRSQHGTE
jgi:hypothetical protein